jgi:glycosyltransferase involved in cell wall biosynthesis
MADKPAPLPRILHCAEMIRGGTATYLRQIIPFQSERLGNKNVIVLIPKSQAQDLPVPEGVIIEFYMDNLNSRLWNAFSLAICALKIARRDKVNIIHLHGTFAGVAIRPILFLFYRKARIIYCAHGWAWDRPMPKVIKFGVCLLERWLANLTDQIVCISEHEFKTAILDSGISNEKLTIVKNGIPEKVPLVNSELVPIWPNEKFRLLFVGRFDYQKGIDVLLSALKLVNNSVHAVLIGDSVLKDLKQELSLTENCTVLGWLNPEQLEAFFNSAQVLVIPSRWEGFGLIAAEAMRAGLPVIASSVGGLPEVVEDGVTGILVRPDSPEELADAILNLDEKKRIHMSKAARKRVVKHFNIKRVNKELFQVYKIET